MLIVRHRDSLSGTVSHTTTGTSSPTPLGMERSQSLRVRQPVGLADTSKARFGALLCHRTGPVVQHPGRPTPSRPSLGARSGPGISRSRAVEIFSPLPCRPTVFPHVRPSGNWKGKGCDPRLLSLERPVARICPNDENLAGPSWDWNDAGTQSRRHTLVTEAKLRLS